MFFFQLGDVLNFVNFCFPNLRMNFIANLKDLMRSKMSRTVLRFKPSFRIPFNFFQSDLLEKVA